jgi:hypothetical protein
VVAITVLVAVSIADTVLLPAVDIVVRGDSHYGRPEAMAWCERKRIGYIFGLAGNSVLLGRVSDLAEDAVAPVGPLHFPAESAADMAAISAAASARL